MTVTQQSIAHGLILLENPKRVRNFHLKYKKVLGELKLDVSPSVKVASILNDTLKS